jgi:hypothetical protein
MLALMRSSSSAVVARGEGCRFRCAQVSTVTDSTCTADSADAGVVTYMVEPSNALVVSPRLWICHSYQQPANPLLLAMDAIKRNVTSVRTSSRVGTRKEILSPDAPRSNTCDERGKCEEGSLLKSALGVPHDQYTHNVYQVPGPEVTYTLARCAIEGRRHDEVLL